MNILHLAKDYVLYIELFKRKEDSPKTRENLSKAMVIFRECGADGWVENYEMDLGELHDLENLFHPFRN